jgi:3-dehydroquinate synthase
LDAAVFDKASFFTSVKRSSVHILLTDSNVAKVLLDKFEKLFADLRINFYLVVVDPGEKSKSIQTYTSVLERCADHGINRLSTVIGVGGGVVKDLAGFLASTYLRGINLVLIPTTPLAQVDAAIDWRHSLNLPEGKNLIGSILAPSEILVNATLFKTLNQRWVRDGLAESIKLALCQNPALLTTLKEVKLSSEEWIAQVIDVSVSKKIVAMDRNSSPDLAMLVYGHAIGHALEHLAEGGFGHGEAISIGMCVTAELSLLTGLSDQASLNAHYEVFQAFDLPTLVPIEYDIHHIWSAICTDKRFRDLKMYAPCVQTIGKLATDESGDAFLPFEEEVVLRALELNRSRIK